MGIGNTSENHCKGLTLEFLSEFDEKSPAFAYLRTVIENAVNIYLKETKDEKLCFRVSKNWGREKPANRVEEDDARRKKRYRAVTPDERYTFERLVLPTKVREQILATLSIFQYQSTIFDDWQLNTIARPMVALSLEGAAGTGKTMTAHAIAHYLGKNILSASYAEIESMYHGEGPKNVQAVFAAAMEQDALLFIDDAESLLSKRLDNVTTGSENSINSMRDQFLISLEQYKGLVVFASNKAESYDPALETRFWTVHFDLPDEDQRREIWRQHLPIQFPVDVSLDDLSKLDGICGREIRSAVLEVASKMIYDAKGDCRKVKAATFDTFKQKINEIRGRRKTGNLGATGISDKTKAFLAENAKRTSKAGEAE